MIAVNVSMRSTGDDWVKMRVKIDEALIIAKEDPNKFTVSKSGLVANVKVE